MVTWTTDSAEEESAAVIWVLVWALVWAAAISAVDSGMVVLRGMPSVAVASATDSAVVALGADLAAAASGADLAVDVDLRSGSEFVFVGGDVRAVAELSLTTQSPSISNLLTTYYQPFRASQ
jgi:hypothetical protein